MGMKKRPTRSWRWVTYDGTYVNIWGGIALPTLTLGLWGNRSRWRGTDCIGWFSPPRWELLFGPLPPNDIPVKVRFSCEMEPQGA